VVLIGIKRARERAQELHAALKIRRKITRKPNAKRNREGLEKELRDIDDATFTRMFRMQKLVFFQLSDRCAPHIKRSTPNSIRMARLSSGSDVSSMILLAATIRWLAGGSLLDIAFMFKMSRKTLHSYKYKVIYAINRTLRGNILFPRTDAGLDTLAKGFSQIGSGMGQAIPGVVAAVDSVCVQMKAPCARKSTNGTFVTSIGQAFNRYGKVHVNLLLPVLPLYTFCANASFLRKGYFATTMLAFVDANLRFLSVSISCYSSSHDSTLFSASKLGKIIAEGRLNSKWLIVGDDAFVCRSNVITPYVKHSLSTPQRNYNYFLSLNRQVSVTPTLNLYFDNCHAGCRESICIVEMEMGNILETIGYC
jgi:hypothetical protein